MHGFCFSVHGSHFVRAFVVNPVLVCNRAEIRVLAVEAAFRRLVRVLEPVVADERPAMQCPSYVTAETRRTLGLGRHLRPRSIGIGQSGIGSTKREFANKAGLAGRSIGVEGGGWLRGVAIEMDNIRVAPGTCVH